MLTRAIQFAVVSSAVALIAHGCSNTIVAVGAAGATGGGGSAVTVGGNAQGGNENGGAGAVMGACGTPVPVGELTPCGGTAGVGAGTFECAQTSCDEAGNSWESVCTIDGCSCNFEFTEVCSCTFPTPQDSCPFQANCCPRGWPTAPLE